MKRRAFLFLGLVALGLMGTVQADDAASPAGTWKWSVTVNDQKRDSTLKLKLDSGKLSGTYIGGQNNQETAIDDATFKDGEVAFSVTRERNGQKRTSKYKGKVSGDSIKGKIEFKNQQGEDQTRDWEATREKA